MTLLTDKPVVQLSLFPEPDIEQHSPVNGAAFHDPAFASNKTRPIHRWVPWIAGFSSRFVRGTLQRYLGEQAVVLDPFAGVGTTLVEAALLGYDTLGFEINPYAALVCQTKLRAYEVDLIAFKAQVDAFYTFYREKVRSAYKPLHVPPKGFKTRSAFFSPSVLRKVLIFWDFVDALPISLIKDLFRLTFASTMVSYSNYSYEPSLGRRVSAGKSEIEDFAVGDSIVSKLSEMLSDIQWSQASLPSPSSTRQVFNDSFFSCRTLIVPASVDLIVTSPPYLNNYHYNRNTRPQLYWLGLVQRAQDMKPLEQANFGKYWQTVRAGSCLALDFELADADLNDHLEAIRSAHPEKGVYGGAGWANYAVSYFNDCYRFAQGINYVLKPGGTAVIVIGNSIVQGVQIPTDQYFAQIARLLGLELVQIDIPRETRVGNSIIQSDVRVAKAKSSYKLYEAVVELRKPL